jgi:hypothetical protein
MRPVAMSRATSLRCLFQRLPDLFGPIQLSFFAGSVLILIQCLIAPVPLAAQASAASISPTPRPTHPHKKAAQNAVATQPAVQPDPIPPTPVVPPPPDWPANDHPSDATVTWDSHGLSIVAANSSLTQILKQVATETGATLQGLARDQRVFGVYGPGPARDVISQLLDGTGYNVLLIGDQGQGTPRQIVLTPRTGSAQPSGNRSPDSGDEDSDAEQQIAQPEPPSLPQQQYPNGPLGMAPGVPMRTQQQIIEELQRRQQQIQQAQQNQNQQ